MFYLVISAILLSFQCNGNTIEWKHVVDLYHRNAGMVTQTPGLSIVPKLKYEHIHLNNFSKMRVDLAAQVCYNIVCLHVSYMILY